jgi:hypothetical protein
LLDPSAWSDGNERTIREERTRSCGSTMCMQRLKLGSSKFGMIICSSCWPSSEASLGQIN